MPGPQVCHAVGHESPHQVDGLPLRASQRYLCNSLGTSLNLSRQHVRLVSAAERLGPVPQLVFKTSTAS